MNWRSHFECDFIQIRVDFQTDLSWNRRGSRIDGVAIRPESVYGITILVSMFAIVLAFTAVFVCKAFIYRCSAAFYVIQADDTSVRKAVFPLLWRTDLLHMFAYLSCIYIYILVCFGALLWYVEAAVYSCFSLRFRWGISHLRLHRKALLLFFKVIFESNISSFFSALHFVATFQQCA